MRPISILRGSLSAACLLAFGPHVHAFSPSPADTLRHPAVNTTQDKIYALSTLWSEARYNFVHNDRLPFDPDSLYRATLPQVIASRDDNEFYDQLTRFMAAFGDAHTQLLSHDSTYNDALYHDDIPAMLTEIDRKIYITSLRKNAGIDSALFRAEIVGIAGQSVSDYFRDHLFPRIASSTEQWSWYCASRKIESGPSGDSLRGLARTWDGDTIPFSIPYNWRAAMPEGDDYWDVPSPAHPKIGLEWKDRIAVLQINSCQETILPLLDSVMTTTFREKEAKGLIIDMRHNSGGSTDVACRLQMYIDPADSLLLFGSQTRINDAYGRSQGNWQEQYADFYTGRAYRTEPAEKYARDTAVHAVQCPVVVLIGVRTASAAEDFLVNLSEVPGRPLFIGQPTCGSTGAPLVIELPHGAWARICTLRITFPYSGKPFVGEGIRPDIEVRETPEAFFSQRDLTMEKALEVIRKM
ncbi:MAG: hypothetical protein LIO68_01800 [Rikenellaceae bacterium]|nr:hypothetical protein [Rikenellaceae bacterium]